VITDKDVLLLFAKLSFTAARSPVIIRVLSFPISSPTNVALAFAFLEREEKVDKLKLIERNGDIVAK